MLYGNPLHVFTLNFRMRILVMMLLVVFLTNCGEAFGLTGFTLVVFTCFIDIALLKLEKTWVTRSRYLQQCASYVGKKVMPVILEDFIDDNYARSLFFIVLAGLTALTAGKFAYVVLFAIVGVFLFMTTRYEEHFWGKRDA